MGLGKTLQCLSVCKSLLKPNRVLQRILIVTPSSLTGNWNNEINKWLKTDRLFAYIVEGRTNIKDYSNQLHLPFVIVSYEMLLSNLEDFKQVHFDLLILDEGHRLKNKSTKIVQGLEET
uniref:Helicase ATP-binding domain-containing protein n=1 Tax=Megaselia scalaris TaxID=36166 RepID=T1GYC2_MEGSC